MWNKGKPDLPWERGEYNESNTLLLDDSPYKALLNPVSQLINCSFYSLYSNVGLVILAHCSIFLAKYHFNALCCGVFVSDNFQRHTAIFPDSYDCRNRKDDALGETFFHYVSLFICSNDSCTAC